MQTVRVHWVRHGKVASHRGNVPLTEEGLAQAKAKGAVLARELYPGERVHFMHAPTRRTKETAEAIREQIMDSLAGDNSLELSGVSEQSAIRNPDLYIAGQRVEMVSSAEALAEQLEEPRPDLAALRAHAFFGGFLKAPERIGYWIGHPEPPGDDVKVVARRQLAFARSLPDIPADRPARYVLVTHSPILRAILAHYLGEDPGEPEYLESIDLTLAPGEAPELRFREYHRVLAGAGTAADEMVPRERVK